MALVAIDFFTGSSRRLHRGEAELRVGYKGIIRKVRIFLMVAVPQIIDTSSGLGEPLLRRVIKIFFILYYYPLSG